jgi:hypothetical protein
VLALLVYAIAEGEQQRHHWRRDVLSAWHGSANRTGVRARLGEPAFTTTIGGASCDVFDVDDSIVDAQVQFPFCYDDLGKRIESPEPLEPNEDVAYLRTYGIPALTQPRKPSVSIHGRLDYWPNRDTDTRLFDSDDVFRIWLPPRRGLRVRLDASADTGLAVWDASTPTVYLDGAESERHLLASDEDGTREITLSRRRAGAAYVFLEVYLLKNGPNHATYRLTLTPIA